MADRPRSASAAVLTAHVDVAAPAEQTWAAAVDWARQGEWMLGTRVRPGEQGGRGVGGGIRAVTGIGRLGIVDTMVITEWSPPRVCRVRHTGRVLRGTAAFEVRERPGGSTFVWSERLDLPLGALGRLAWRVVRPAFGWGVRRSLRRFAGWAPSHRLGESGRLRRRETLTDHG